VRLAGRLDTAATPLDSLTFRAAVSVVLARDQSDPAGIGRLGYPRFARLVTSQLARWGGVRRCQRIMRAVWTAATDPSRLTDGVLAQRPGGLERAALVLGDWHHALGQLAETEQRMTGILDQLQLTSLVASIPGLSAVGAAAILAETGDQPASTPPARWSSTPACAPATTSPAPTPAPPASPGEADPPCGWRPGGPSGVRCTPTPSSAPATSTSPAATTTSSPPPSPHRAGRGPAAVAVGRGHQTGALAGRHRRRPARPPQGGDRPSRLIAADQRAGRARLCLGNHPATEHEQPRPSPPQARIQDVGTTRLDARQSRETGQGTAHSTHQPHRPLDRNRRCRAEPHAHTPSGPSLTSSP
jgi:hypothetical protein